MRRRRAHGRQLAGGSVFPLRPGSKVPALHGRARVPAHRRMRRRSPGLGATRHHRPRPDPSAPGRRPVQHRYRHRPIRSGRGRPGHRQARRRPTPEEWGCRVSGTARTCSRYSPTAPATRCRPTPSPSPPRPADCTCTTAHRTVSRCGTRPAPSGGRSTPARTAATSSRPAPSWTAITA